MSKMLSRRVEADTDALQSVVATLHAQIAIEQDTYDAAFYAGGVNALGILLDGNPETYGDFIVDFERACIDSKSIQEV